MSVMQYRLPSGFLAGIALEFDGQRPLYGAAESVGILAPGSHVVDPYHAGSNVFDTFSATRSGPGAIRYSGMLLGHLPTMRTLFESIGTLTATEQPARLKLVTLDGLQLVHWKIWDIRTSGIDLSPQAWGNTLMIRGQITLSFRKMEALPYT